MEIELNKHLKSLTSNSVISCGESQEISKFSSLLLGLTNMLEQWERYSTFKETIVEKMREQKVNISCEVFDDGFECEVLDIDCKEWKKGKLKAKLVLEFIPSEPEITEPESPLDEIRREISQLKQES